MSRLRNRQGIALVVTLLVLIAVAAISATAATLAMNTQLVNRAEQQQGVLTDVALSGLALARADLNGGADSVPDTGFVTLESSAAVRDASGHAIPGVTRSVYAGPRGVIRGQYGVYASVVSVAHGGGGQEVIRRADVRQESFAKYAYFTDVEPSNISFGGGDQLFGPVHTNDYLKIYSSGATFHGPVTTSRTVQGGRYGHFDKGYEEGVARIEMPTTEDLNRLQTLAASGNMDFTGSTGGSAGQSTLRLQFVALDVNGDGDVTDDDEGFVMAYQASNPAWVVADVPSGGLKYEPNCGHFHQPGNVFVSVVEHPNNGPDSKQAALSSSSARCFLGGDSTIFNAFTPTDTMGGHWLAWPGAVDTALTNRFGTLANYLFPMGRRFNPDFKGVIHVTGKVGVSGTVHGRVTLAATGNIIIVDDIVYATDPAAPGREATCDDLLGLFSADDVIVADNAINSPQQPNTSGWGSNNYFTYDDTKDEFIDGTVLALNTFTVENYASGATTAERCESNLWGRGCLYLTGGVIQETRGPVGTIWSVGGTGYTKRYAYDNCAASMPPPYFPTTGHFNRDRIFNVDPVGFNIASYFAQLAPGSN